MNRKNCLRAIGYLGLCWFATRAFGAEALRLTLPEAVQMALRGNRALKIARLKVVEQEQKKAAAKSGYFPELKNFSSVLRTTAEQNITIPAGAFGVLPAGGYVPGRDVLINQGGQTLVSSGTSLVQPLTPLIRIREANRIAASEVAVSRDELKKAENEVALEVHAAYYGILIARLQQQAAEQETDYASVRLRESEDDVRNGAALRVSTIEARSGLLEGKQAVLTSSLRVSDLTTELNDLLGLPLDTALELSAIEPASLDQESRDEYLQKAWADSPEILTAAQKVQQAKAAVTAKKSTYIPDIAAFARHSYQNGVPFLVHNFGTVGVNLTYDVFDFGKRRAEVREREAQLAQAEENLRRVKEALSVRIERTYNKVERTKQMIQVAAEVVALRTENERLTGNQLAEGVVLVSSQRRTSAASLKARADLLQAHLSYLLARAELDQVAGRTPGL
jgi:outer membrane protein TolC